MGRYRKTRREKNIRKDDYTGEWLVLKRFKQFQEPYIYGRFNTFSEAKKYRNYLDKNNAWRTELPNHKRYELEQQGRNYIQTKNGSCYIYRTRNYIRNFYGRYKNKEDAEKVVYHLVCNDWDYNSLPDEIKELRLPSKVKQQQYAQVNLDSPEHVAVQRKVGDKAYHYGVYPSEKEAEKVIRWLNTNGWGNPLPSNLENLQLKKRIPRNYSKTSIGNYNVHKVIDGKSHHFGTYSTEEDAQHAVEELRKHDWDKDWFKNNRSRLNANPRYNTRS